MKSPGSIDLTSIQSKTAQGAQNGQIDATSNMHNDKVYIFDGTLDTTVNPGIFHIFFIQSFLFETVRFAKILNIHFCVYVQGVSKNVDLF